MSLTIPALEHGQIRVFAVTGPVPAGMLEKTPDALKEALGTDALDPDFVDVFDTMALDEMTVADFLRHGYDLTPDAADLAMLKGLDGIVLLLMSRATKGAEVTLTLGPGVQHVTTLGEQARLSAAQPLESQSTQGIIENPQPKSKKSDARIGGMVATVALLVMMLLVGLMIWVGG